MMALRPIFTVPSNVSTMNSSGPEYGVTVALIGVLLLMRSAIPVPRA
jgi:hypothetical protein